MNGLRASSWVADLAAFNAEGAKAEAVPKVARRDRAESFMVSGVIRYLQIVREEWSLLSASQLMALVTGSSEAVIGGPTDRPRAVAMDRRINAQNNTSHSPKTLLSKAWF